MARGKGYGLKEIDKGYNKIMAELKKMAKGPYVKVGILSSKNPKKQGRSNDGGIFTAIDAPTVAEIAAMHEFGGDPSPPERSFMRATLDKNRAEYIRITDGLKTKILTGKMTTERALKILGLKIVSDIKNTIREGIKPDLAESTIRRKNAAQIGKAQGQIAKLEAKMTQKGKLSKAEKNRLNKASDIVLTGGKSVPLIDTGQMINSIQSAVDMNDGGKK